MQKAQSTSKTAVAGLASLTILFFVWGFLTSLNDILVPHLKSVFTLTYAQAALIQFAFFLAYFCSSLPAGSIVSRFGYKNGLAIGLASMAVGSALFLPAAAMISFPMFLGALFILASGITLLQVSANPYVTLLGKPETASARLNLTQAFNALGTTMAPIIGGTLILAAADSEGHVAMDAATQAASVKGPYLVISLILIILAIAFYFMRLPEPDETPVRLSRASVSRTIRVPNLLLGVVAIFVYVGAEVAIGTFLVNLIMSAIDLPGGAHQASHYVAFYWGCAMVGRFIGSGLMRRIKPGTLLAVAALTATTLVIVSFLTTGYLSIYAMIAVGLCNSIMFPTIFSLGVHGLHELTGVGSSLLIMAIVGGAIIPLMVGALADTIGLKSALILPALCYAYISYYGHYSTKTMKTSASHNQ